MKIRDFYCHFLFRDDVCGCIYYHGEEIAGPHATPHLGIVAALNLPWLLIPLILTGRMLKEHPFTKGVVSEISQVGHLEGQSAKG